MSKQQIEVAKALASNAKVMNEGAQKQQEIYDAWKKFDLETQESSWTQKKQSFSHFSTFLVAATAGFASKMLGSDSEIAANALEVFSNQFPNITNGYSKIQDGNNTLYSNATRYSEVAASKINTTLESANAQIKNNVENATRILAKEF